MFEHGYPLDAPDVWDGFFWGKRSLERSDLLDVLYFALAQRLCDAQAAARAPAPGCHGSERAGGLPCEECNDLAYGLINGEFGKHLSTFGQTAYQAGRGHVPEGDAAIRALRAVSHPLKDRLDAEHLLRSIHGGPSDKA